MKTMLLRSFFCCLKRSKEERIENSNVIPSSLLLRKHLIHFYKVLNLFRNMHHLMMMMKVLMLENQWLTQDVHVLLYQYVYANSKHLLRLIKRIYNHNFHKWQIFTFNTFPSSWKIHIISSLKWEIFMNDLLILTRTYSCCSFEIFIYSTIIWFSWRRNIRFSK